MGSIAIVHRRRLSIVRFDLTIPIRNFISRLNLLASFIKNKCSPNATNDRSSMIVRRNDHAPRNRDRRTVHEEFWRAARREIRAKIRCAVDRPKANSPRGRFSFIFFSLHPSLSVSLPVFLFPSFSYPSTYK